MHDPYEPKSNFLKAVAAGEAPLSGSEWAEENLDKLIELTRDEDLSNRDWATFLLAQGENNISVVKDALLRAANDENDIVRAEAVLGLAKRDVQLALPFVQEALQADAVSVSTFEAAAICAHSSLIPGLRIWAKPSDDPFLDETAAEALAVCEAAAPMT